MDTAKTGKLTYDKGMGEFFVTHPHMLPYLNYILCPQCGSRINADRIGGINDPPAGWCMVCRSGVEEIIYRRAA